ncbi:MAG: NAD(P)-binding domain-containing protein [Chitinophagales bacterium]
MTIAIIGSGNVAGALAQSLLRAKHTVLIGARFPLSEKSLKLAALIGEDRFTSIENAAAQAEVIIIAATPPAVPAIATALGDVTNKIIIDAMNSVRTRPEGFQNTTEALTALTNCKQIVKCFNTTGAENMLHPQYGNTAIDVFMSGDNEHAKSVTAQLASDIGFGNCYNFGTSAQFALQEQLALCWINLAMQGHGRNLALTVVKR